MNRQTVRAILLGVGFAVVLGVNLTAFGRPPVVVQLDFDTLLNNEPINSYYDGGFGGLGSGPGPAYGVQFSSASLALKDADAGGTGNFENNPSGDNIMFFLSGSPVMNYPTGFDTAFSFFYALQTGFSSTVTVYDGVGGTGTALGTVNLLSTPDPYNVWVPVAIPFLGTGKSVVFTGDANFVGYDNFTFGSTDPGNIVPTPSAGLAGLALIGSLVGAKQLKKRRNEDAA